MAHGAVDRSAHRLVDGFRKWWQDRFLVNVPIGQSENLEPTSQLDW
jgi:hypothetical protein